MQQTVRSVSFTDIRTLFLREDRWNRLNISYVAWDEVKIAHYDSITQNFA